MRVRPFFSIGLASFSALLVCSVLPLVGTLIVMLVLLVAVCGAVIVRRHPNAKVMAIALVTALLLCGSFLLKHALFVYPILRYADTTAYVTVRVEEVLTVGERYTVKTVDGDLPDGIRLCMFTDGMAVPLVGDTITAQVSLTTIVDKYNDREDPYAKANGVYLNAFIDDTVPFEWRDGSDNHATVARMIASLREKIRETFYCRLSYDDAALCESMVLGIRDNLLARVETDFRVCGVYHLLVVSGLHLSLITGVVLKILCGLRVARKARIVTAMAATVFFAVLCGCGASVSRAAFMMLIMLAAHLFHRDSDGLNSLGIAAVIMLMIDPFCIYDRGWQLSFAATFGILLIMPIWEKQITARIALRWCRPLVSAVGVALSATVMTQPLTALYFGEVSLVFLLGNLLCVTVSSLLLVMCFSAVAVTAIPLIGDALYGGIHIGCSFLTSATAWVARLPFACVTVHEPFAVLWMFAFAAVLGIAYAFFKMRGILRALPVMFSILWVCVAVFAACDGGVSTVQVFSTQTTALAVDTKDSRGLVFEGDAQTFERITLQMEASGVRHLDWLLWLNTPLDSEVDVSKCSLAVDLLITLDDTSAFERLPSAAQYQVLASGETLAFSKNASLARDRDAYYLRIGQTKMLLCPKTKRSLAVAQEWEKTDVAIVRSSIPKNFKQLDTDHVVIYAPFGNKPYYENRLSRTLETVHYAADDGALYIQTRGYGDITLRDE